MIHFDFKWWEILFYTLTVDSVYFVVTHVLEQTSVPIV